MATLRNPAEFEGDLLPDTPGRFSRLTAHLQPRLGSTWLRVAVLFLVAGLANLLHSTTSAESPAPPPQASPDSAAAAFSPESSTLRRETIEEQLARQQAEIEWLKQRLFESRPELASDAAVLAPPPLPTPGTSLSTPSRETTNDSTPEWHEVLHRLDELERRQPTPTPPKNAAAPAEGEWVDVSQEKWTVKLAGHVQLDLVNWAQASPAITGDQDYFEFRRLRLVADGTGYGMCDFRLQLTLEPETIGENLPGIIMSPDVKDAYFSMNEIPGLGRFRIGNFFVPFSLEQVTNDTNNIFMERSIPTQGIFSPDREVGMAIYNSTDDKNISWAYGIFLDSIGDGIKERIDDNQGYRLSGRLNWVPYYDEPSNGRYAIHTGVGVLHTDDQDDRVRFRARPQIHEGPRLIDSGVLAASDYTTGNLELAVVWGRVTVQSEAFVSSVHMTAGNSANLTGAYAHISYFLTGENRVYERFGQHGAQFARNSPYSNFFIVPGGWSPGAWEVKSRWSTLNLDDVERGQYNDLTVGLNWYWSDRTRVMFDWIHPYTTQQTTFGATQSDILALRFDFNW